MVNVSEIFLSYQGEGPLMGSRTLFVRLQGCNMRCQWCDTSHTWGNTYGQEMTAEQLLTKAKAYKKDQDDTFDICITGGEPLLQQNDKDLLEFLFWAQIGRRITVETNGTIVPEMDFAKTISMFSVSPKLMASGAKNAVNALRLNEFEQAVSKIDVPPRIIYKYVVDLNNIQAAVEEISAIHKVNPVRNDNIFLMPLGAERDKVLQGTEMLTRWMRDHFVPYSISTRLQFIAGCY